MTTAIFDLDGTLADTSGDLIAAANACFEAVGAGPMLDPLRDAPTAFRGGRAMLRLGVSRMGRAGDEDFVEAQFQPFLDHYAAHIDVHTRLYPGAAEAIAALRAAGVATGICTNKPEGLAVRLIDRLGVAHLFDSLIGADTLPVRKPDPAPYVQAVERAGGVVGQSLLVGDTETDVATAAAAGVPCILVGFGPEGAGIARLGPDAMLGSYADLAPTVRRFF